MWQQLPPLALPSPVFALATGRNKVWAGGVGGVACYSADGAHEAWEQGSATLPLSAVTTLLFLDGFLLAGGSEGIAYSYDNGATWQQAEVEDGMVSVVALVASPNFSSDQTAVAATLDQGIIRTNDGGRTWINASFGLESMEVSALAWGAGATVMAATSDGMYRSRDAGRAWRRIYASEELDIEALVFLPDGVIVAALGKGGLLCSQDDGRHWLLNDQGFQDVQALALCVIPAGTLFLGTLERGLLRSDDAGATWQVVHERAVHVCIQGAGNMYAGTDTGLSMSSDDGLTWSELPTPPLHDLRALLVHEECLLLAGTYSGIVRAAPAAGWEPLERVPQPLTAFAFMPDNALLLSGPDGLVRLSFVDGTQQSLMKGPAGQVAHITLRRVNAVSHIWVASTDGTSLLHSADEGATWQPLPAPFGVLPLVALQAVADRLLAATYDPRQYRICLWYSTDDGKTWIRSMEVSTNWPVVATCTQPPALSIASILFFEHAAGKWQQVTVGHDGSPVRRVLGVQIAEKNILLALTTTGILRSEDMGETWQQENAGLPVSPILDIAITGTTLFVLLAGAQVWQRDLQETLP